MPFQVTSYHGPSLQGVLPKGGSATGTFQTDTTSSKEVLLFQDLSLLVCAIPLQLENETEVVPSTFAASGFPVGIAFRLSNGFASTSVTRVFNANIPDRKSTHLNSSH